MNNESFLQQIANWDWNPSAIWHWFVSTFAYYSHSYGWVGGAIFILVVIFILTQIEFTRGLMNYLLQEVVGTTLRNIITGGMAGLVLFLVWLRAQFVARGRDALRYIRELF